MSQIDSTMSQEDETMSKEDESMSEGDDTTSEEDDDSSEDDGPVYSRDEVVEEVTKFYEFLTGLHVPEDELLYPPDDGWDNIGTKSMAWLGKDDTVIDLMRHLPYISRDHHCEAYGMLIECAPVDYQGPYVDSCRDKEVYAIEFEYPRPPPYMLTLASQSGRDGHYVLINTKNGTVVLCDPMYGVDTRTLGKGTIKNEGSEEGEEVEEGDDWRKHSTWRVSEFFELLTEKFRSLELMPRDGKEITRNTDKEDPVAKIFREYGWPEPIDKQEECLEKVHAFLDEEDRIDEMEREAKSLQISGDP